VFLATLNEILESIDGCLMVTILGYDGIDLARAVAPSVVGQTDHLVVETAALMKRMSRVAKQLQMGAVKELSLEAEELLLVLRPIDETYVLAVALKPDGNLGMARYQLAAKVPDLRRSLAV
jgi:predicted regulator of Ras-like GTPase activity (Roadblock/LC7/MglB family)